MIITMFLLTALYREMFEVMWSQSGNLITQNKIKGVMQIMVDVDSVLSG